MARRGALGPGAVLPPIAPPLCLLAGITFTLPPRYPRHLTLHQNLSDCRISDVRLRPRPLRLPVPRRFLELLHEH